MSKLLSKLEKINRGSPARLGFSTASRTERTPSMALIGRLSQNYTQGAKRLAKVEADGALLDGGGLESKLPEAAAALGSIPWGIRADGLDGEGARELLEKGCDFFVVSPDKVTVEAVKDDRAAYLLVLPQDADERFLRAIEDLPVDAVIMSLGSPKSPLTLQHLITVCSVRSLFDKYLAVEAPVDLSSKEIEGLRDVGVDALVVDAARSSERTLGNLKEALLSAPRQRRSRSERVSPVLPRGSYAEPSHSHEEDDEDWMDTVRN